MDTLYKIIPSWLALSCLSLAEPPSTERPPTDGMVNIGGVLYPEEEMKDSERRRKAELLATRIEQMKEANLRPRDYSETPTSELLTMALGTMNNVNWDAALKELSERPDEARTAIEELLQNEKPFYDVALFFSRLPAVAQVLGTNYEAEVAKEVLNHPLTKEYDQAIWRSEEIASMMGRSFLDHLKASRRDETGTLDKLIEEGRLERGSEFELKWRKLLSGNDRKEKNRAEKSGIQNIRTQDRDTVESPEANSTSGSSLNRTYIVLGSFIAFLGILVLLFKVWKGKAER